MTRTRLARTVVEALAFLAVVGGLSAVLAHAALQRYDAFDMSSFMDAGWRVLNGQRPYVDFYFIAGPIHPWMHAIAYAAFGFGKPGVVAHLLVVNAAVVAATWAIARRHVGLAECVLAAVVASLSFYGPIAHPWYDQNAALWLVLGAVLFELRPPTERVAVARAAALGALAVLAFMTKANVGLAGAATFLLALVAGPRPRASMTGYALGAAATVGLVFVAISPADFVYQTFLAYRPQERFADIGKLVAVARLTPFVVLLGLTLALASVGGRAFVGRYRDRFVLLVGLLGTSVFSAWTGSMLVPANVVLAGIEATLLLVLAHDLPPGAPGTTECRVRRTAIGGLVACSLVLVAFAADLTRTHAVWTWRASNFTSDYELTTPAMRGWRCNRRTCEGIDRAVAWIQANVPSGETLFVFPDATVVYGLTGRDSWRKAPFIFHEGQVPAPGLLYDEFRTHFVSAPPRWILLHNQTEMAFFNTVRLLRWLRLDAFIDTRYRVVWSWGEFAMLRLAEPSL